MIGVSLKDALISLRRSREGGNPFQQMAQCLFLDTRLRGYDAVS